MKRRTQILLGAAAIGAVTLGAYSLHDPNARLRQQVEQAQLQSALGGLIERPVDTSRVCVLGADMQCNIVPAWQFWQQEREALAINRPTPIAPHTIQVRIPDRMKPADAQAIIDAWVRQ